MAWVVVGHPLNRSDAIFALYVLHICSCEDTMFLISNLEDAASFVAHEASIGAKTIAHGLAVVAKDASPAVVEGLTAMIDPAAVKYERLAFALLGPAAHAASAVADAAQAEFISIPTDKTMLLALKDCWEDLKAQLAMKGIVPKADTTK